MFNRLFRRKPITSSAQAVLIAAPDLFKNPEAEMRTIRLLSADHGARIRMSHQDAKVVVDYMLEKTYQAGKMVLAEGDGIHVDYLLVVIDGEVSVESIMPGQKDPITLTVLGPGSILGELGVIDGGSRSASCVAVSDLTCALLTGEAFERLMREHPAVGVNLMLLIAKRMAERLRDNTEKLKVSVQLSKTMMEELAEGR